jgi:hypothetical protein
MIYLSHGSRHLIQWGGSETGGLISQTIGNNQAAGVEESATCINRYFHFSSQPSHSIHPSPGPSALFVRCLGPAARGRVGAAATAVRKPLTEAFPSSFVRHFSVPGGCGSISRLPQPRLSRRNGQAGYPVEHPAKQPSPHMTLRQEQPIIAGMFHQPPAGLHQSLLQARSWSPVLFLSRSPLRRPERRSGEPLRHLGVDDPQHSSGLTTRPSDLGDQAECAKVLGVSARTIGRIVGRIKVDGRI